MKEPSEGKALWWIMGLLAGVMVLAFGGFVQDHIALTKRVNEVEQALVRVETKVDLYLLRRQRAADEGP